MHTQSHRPTASRAVAGHTCLRPTFAQSVDRSRPRELLVPEIHGLPQNPAHLPDLEYRYLDTHETVTVPNVWYNQTQEMRVEAWAWHVRQYEAHTQQAKTRLDIVESFNGERYMGRPTTAARQRARVDFAQAEQRLADTRQTLADVAAGIRFV